MEVQPLSKEQLLLKTEKVELAVTNDAVVKGNVVESVKADAEAAENVIADAGVKADAAVPKVHVKTDAAEVQQKVQVTVMRVPTAKSAEAAKAAKAAKAEASPVEIDADAIAKTNDAVRLGPS